MPADIYRTRMIELYTEMREADMFLSGFFEVRPGNISDTEKVRIDIVRQDEDISPVVNLFEGPTFNTLDEWTTKEWVPPTIQEAVPFTSAQLLKRQPGVDEYRAVDVGYQAQMVAELMRGMQLMDGKIRRNIEWQASQILQSGILTLKDEDGNNTYTVDYKPKAAHFPTVATAWDQAGATPLRDIEALADVIRDNGLQDANRVIMGQAAFAEFQANPTVQQAYDNRRMDLGVIAPEPRGQGAKFQGTIHIGAYNFELWTYSGRGIQPGDTVKNKFVSDEKVIVMAGGARLDRVFGGIPQPVRVDPRFADFLPERVSIPAAIDVSPNIYSDASGRSTILELASRPLCVPTAIDSFGCLDTGL